MQTTKLFNYVTGAVALIHAGTTSKFMQEVMSLPQLAEFSTNMTQLESYDEMTKLMETLPESYFVATGLFLLTGTCLFILGVVTLVLNIRLDKSVSVRRTAIWTSVATLFGVFLSIIPFLNIIHPIILSILYIVSGYFMPQKK